MSDKEISRRQLFRYGGMIAGAGVVAGLIDACAPQAPAPAAAGPTAAAAPAGDKPGKGMYFRLVTHGGNDPFWAVVKQGMVDAAALYGCKAEIDLAGSDLAKQQKMFQEAVASKPNGIALVINNDQVWDKPVADALAAGIPVIGINNDDTKGAAGNKRLCYIGQNESRAGQVIATQIFSQGKAKGIDMAKARVAAAAEVPTAAYAIVRAAGIKQAMADVGITTPLDVIDAGGVEMTTVEQRETAYLTAHPDVTFMMGLGGICTDRLSSALKNTGKKPGDIMAGGFDTSPGTVEGLKEGYLVATIDQQQYLQGYFAVATLVLYNLYRLTPNIDTGGYLVTKDNLGVIEKLSGKYR